MAEATMRELEFAVILVTNHRIMFLNEREASGEVWARCYAQNKTEGYYEQIIKYTDQYELSKPQNLNKENGNLSIVATIYGLVKVKTLLNAATNRLA